MTVSKEVLLIDTPTSIRRFVPDVLWHMRMPEPVIVPPVEQAITSSVGVATIALVPTTAVAGTVPVIVSCARMP